MMSGDGGREYDGMASKLPPAQESRNDTPSCSTTEACGWQIVSASAPGAIHERRGAPNQDALCWWSAEREKPLAVLCVADGHGGGEYTRSDIGARRAVAQAQMLLVSEALPRILDGSARRDWTQFERQIKQRLPKELVNRWRTSIYQHATDNPISEDETSCPDEEAAAPQQDTPVERRYGATLLAALLTPELHLYIQLGDGDILTISADGEVTRPPFETDSYLIANHTTSLCSKDAWRFVRIHFQSIVDNPPVFVMLATDGYANSFAEDADFEQVARDLYTAIQEDGPAAVADHLPSWLEATSKGGSGDDISVVIAAEADRLR